MLGTKNSTWWSSGSSPSFTSLLAKSMLVVGVCCRFSDCNMFLQWAKFKIGFFQETSTSPSPPLLQPLRLFVLPQQHKRHSLRCSRHRAILEFSRNDSLIVCVCGVRDSKLTVYGCERFAWSTFLSCKANLRDGISDEMQFCANARGTGNSS